MRLFISHASEDQDEFVRPLAEALRHDYDVWYAPYKLTIGDSLLGKINEGLGSCDFGIVVLSHSFFSKKWPQAELDGLFALESTSRKIILPIWKDVSVEDVRTFSPILAGRLAVPSSEGVQAVVAEIKRAVEVSERTRELTILESATQRVRKLDQSLTEKREAERLLNSTKGMQLVSKELQLLFGTLKSVLSEVGANSEILKFTFSEPRDREFYAHTAYGLILALRMRNLYVNSASDCVLKVNFLHWKTGQFGEPRAADSIHETELNPSFRSPERVIWNARQQRKTYGTEELVGVVITDFTKEIERRTSAHD